MSCISLQRQTFTGTALNNNKKNLKGGPGPKRIYFFEIGLPSFEEGEWNVTIYVSIMLINLRPFLLQMVPQRKKSGLFSKRETWISNRIFWG